MLEHVVGLIGIMITLILLRPLPPNPNPRQPFFHCKVCGHDVDHCFALHPKLQ
jgi:hypothetical protein